MKVMVLGGAGFIGSHFVKLLTQYGADVLVYDKLTYAHDPNSKFDDERVNYVEACITDRVKLFSVFKSFAPNFVLNFAAETHVDNSIKSNSEFIKTNVLGVQVLLDAIVEIGAVDNVKLIHMSTDEVYGDIGVGMPSTEKATLSPSNPYAATKAAAEHLINASSNTFGINYSIVRSCNVFGPRQHREKLIPKSILSCLSGNTIKLYGHGKQKRQWIFVDSCCQAIKTIMLNGKHASVYNIGTNNSFENYEIAKKIISYTLDRDDEPDMTSKIVYVADRPGHDQRYELNFEKIARDLKWTDSRNFDADLKETCNYYRHFSTIIT